MAFLEFNPQGTYYQYTTVEGFQGITASKSIWLSDLAHSNDPRDIVFGLDTVDRIIGDVRHTDYEGIIGQPISYIWARAKGYYKINRLFTACFTPERDNLNMWREYGGRGRGVCIGFRARALTDMHGRIYNVRYIDDDIEAALRSHIVKLFEPLLSDPYQQNFADLVANINFGTQLITYVNSIKHRSWAYEKEMRLTYASGIPDPEFPLPVTVTKDDEELYYTPPLTRLRGNTEVQYYAQSFGKYNRGSFDPSGAISHLILGPHCEWSVEDASNILTQQGFRDFQVSRSECQFRP